MTNQKRVRAIVILLILGVALTLTAAASDGPPLTNADVVKLVNLDLGDEVVIAKIKQAAEVDFDLSTDGLVALKESKVSRPVITAMLERTTEADPLSSPATTPAPQSDALGHRMTISVNNKDVSLVGAKGDYTVVGFWPVYRSFLDYQGLHANIRTSNLKPQITIASAHDPTGYFFLARLDVNDGDNNRSLRVEQLESGFSASARIIPSDEIEYNVASVKPGVWRIQPKDALRPGEYGIVVSGGILYEFGID